MKKILILVLLATFSARSFAQSINLTGMETWNVGLAGVTPVTAPDGWHGMDSLIIADGTAFGFLIGAGHNWHQQIFKEPVKVHSGSYSAKLVTQKQDTLGNWAGILSNSRPSVNVLALIGGGNPASAITFNLGTPVNYRVISVSGWVNYVPAGMDTGSLTVLALANIGGIDSTIGTGVANIDSTGGWYQVTSNIIYNPLIPDTIMPDTVRIFFASSARLPKIGTVLYVDDVSMLTNVGVVPVDMGTEAVKVYPNPTNSVVHFNCPLNHKYSFKMYSVIGQQVAEKPISGIDVLDISSITSGVYFYSIANEKGEIVQQEKLLVDR